MAERLGRALGAVAVLTPFVIGLTAAGGSEPGDVAFRFEDPEIVESSGLVIEGDRAHTINDSGDIGRVFTVDTTSGETVGVTYWDDGPEDVEALAPAGPGHVWVADIGDNSTKRDSVEVTRVPVGDGDRTVDEETVDLVYPDGPRDAEALLVHPVTGRVYVATKGFFAGELYEAPPELAADAPNMLGKVGDVAGIVTDGAFFPDGEHLVLRTYTNAVVYAFPSMEKVGAFDLPSQEQGEGIAAPSTRFVYVSSEGQRAPVLKVLLPADIRSALAPTTTPTPTPTTTPAASPSTGTGTDDGSTTAVDDLADAAARRSFWWWAVGSVVLGGALVVLVRSLRPR
ncbi:hypothetical protein [Nocardioides currus]|uniref:WD40 repeat domain-containing protein n=1 Tax=Nocardioides currus TaxID=2133958 RepID=A0A2R7Z1P1_9ACTN|nr:hypothetical protein [Nocardioides currus]PUA82541.1 hypothetical protein C7S10_02035 [Nocardioides currus]